MLLSSMVMVGQGSYGLKISFGGANKGVNYGGLSYHGPNSALLSVNEKFNTSSTIITLVSPLPLESLEGFPFQFIPLTGAGKLKVKFYLVCNGGKK